MTDANGMSRHHEARTNRSCRNIITVERNTHSATVAWPAVDVSLYVMATGVGHANESAKSPPGLSLKAFLVPNK